MTVTREQVEALLAGCEGVTDGPWAQDDRISTWIMAGDLHVATIPQAHDGDWSPSNAAHIARCDPDTIAALCTAYLEAEDRESALTAKLEQAKAALEPFARHSGYYQTDDDGEIVSATLQIGYFRRARDTLANLEKE